MFLDVHFFLQEFSIIIIILTINVSTFEVTEYRGYVIFSAMYI